MNEHKEKLKTWLGSREAGPGWIKRCLLGSAVFAAGVVVCFLAYVWIGAPDLDEVDVAPDGYRSTVLDDQGTVILTLMGEESNRIYVELDEIPLAMQKAIVAIEDERFYDHSGIDLRGIARAAYRNLRAGRLTEGASTITQQLIKNNVFSDWTQERTVMDKVSRKLQEQLLALQLERRESKDWILENYLNTINFGGGTWGVQTAAMRYFGKDVSELTLSECAVLAAIPKSPTGYNPLSHPENNSQRRILVLDKMLELGMISREEWEDAAADPVYERIQRDHTPVIGSEVYSYFEDALIYQLVEDLVAARGCSEEDAWNLLYRGGLTIYSTQDTVLQELCETEVNRDAWYGSYSANAQVSVVIMEPESGQVKAIVGGRGEKENSLTLNRAVSSVRQPGSTIKVVGAYAAALDRGEATLGTVYDDAPYAYGDGTAIRNAGGTYSGKTTIRQAIVQSTNVVALKCFQQMGLDTVFSKLQQFGFSHLTDADRVEALALGGTHGGVTNLELTAAYSAIANSGIYLEPVYYTKVLDRGGRVLLSGMQEERRAVQSSTAALLTAAMGSVMTEGTGVSAAFSGMPLAGKSGTTTGSKDLWFVGYSPYYACGVWGGYDDGSGQSGKAYVKNIWRAVMQRAHEGKAYKEFDGMDALASAVICTKCGDLAVEQLCDDTIQGDMTRVEYFAPGTEPTESCSCHVEVSICEHSGEAAGRYCWIFGAQKQVYLVEGTAGTADAAAVAPEMEGICRVHPSFWGSLFRAEGSGKTEVSDGAESGALPDEKPRDRFEYWLRR